MNSREKLFNSLIDVLKEQACEMEIGAVRAVLQEVDGAIAMGFGRMPFEIVQERLKKKPVTEQGYVR